MKHTASATVRPTRVMVTHNIIDDDDDGRAAQKKQTAKMRPLRTIDENVEAQPECLNVETQRESSSAQTQVKNVEEPSRTSQENFDELGTYVDDVVTGQTRGGELEEKKSFDVSCKKNAGEELELCVDKSDVGQSESVMKSRDEAAESSGLVMSLSVEEEEHVDAASRTENIDEIRPARDDVVSSMSELSCEMSQATTAAELDAPAGSETESAERTTVSSAEGCMTSTPHDDKTDTVRATDECSAVQQCERNEPRNGVKCTRAAASRYKRQGAVDDDEKTSERQLRRPAYTRCVNKFVVPVKRHSAAAANKAED